MAKYKIEYDTSKERTPATSILIITNTETGESYKISKMSIAKGYPIDFNQDICNALFEIDDLFYKLFPIEFRTDEMTEQMIQKYKLKYYEYFPSKYHTKEMQQKLCEELYNYYWKKNPEEGEVTRDIGRYTITYKLIKERIHPVSNVVVKDNETGDVMKFSKSTMSKKQISFTQELCDALCEIDDLFYKRIPVEFRSDELTKKMIKKYNHRLYEYYPESYRDKNMTIDYVRTTGSHFIYVPQDEVNQQLCDIYIFSNPRNLWEIPEQFVKSEYFDYIIKKGLHLGNVPVEYRTADVCMKFINSHPSNLGYIPDDVLPEIYERIHCEKIYNEPKGSMWMQTKEQQLKKLLKRKKD